MHLTESERLSLARSFTELAIQNDLVPKFADAKGGANEIATFFNVLINSLGDSSDED